MKVVLSVIFFFNRDRAVTHKAIANIKGLDPVIRAVLFNNKQAIQISQNLGQKIEEKLIFLGLDGDQERDLMKIIDHSTQKLNKLMGKQSTIKDALHYIVQQMNKALNKT